MATPPPELQAHLEWLGQIQQVGLVASPQVLVNNGIFIDRHTSAEVQTRLRSLAGAHTLVPFLVFAKDILEWPDGLLAGDSGGPDVPVSLTVALPTYEDSLSPTYVVPDPRAAGEWLALIRVESHDINLDKPNETQGGWRASPHARLERLLHETGVPIGLLYNGTALRLVYAPRGESSGHLTFRFAYLLETQGRPMAGALYSLLGVERVTDVSLDEQRLPYLLKESRRYQNDVSTRLAGQVLEALWELLRGLQRANEESRGMLLADVLREQPDEVYGALLTTMMRLVFILYAEDRGLMPASEVYQRYYSVSGLFERLREDQARYPDTMDARYGAWAQLLVLFRLIHDGGGHQDLHFPKRHGRLFDPDVYPFLEGRPHRSHRQLGETTETPRIADGVVFRLLQNLLMLEGERLSYRALDVEQIGSVYEAMMGFALQVAAGPSIAVSPKHVVVSIEELLEQKGKDRPAWLKERTELKLSADGLAKAQTVDDVVAALGKKVSRYTPHILRVGALYLQPTEERRRSGSHYTPRSLTAPIVQTTLRPIFERLGERPTPEQILDLKICDPAMGSGAFLVETCRLLGERLVAAWEMHKSTPRVPEDEDALTFARRLIAERCLYGVDKNVFAVDLAKLSLWLATLAREHPFTFLDHALRHGDSLVGLSREQIACLHWAPSKQPPLTRSFINVHVAEAQELRIQIQGLGQSDDVPEKARLLREAEDAVADVRLIGDAVVSAFFEREKPKDRETLRVVYAGKVDVALPPAVESDRSLNPEIRRELADVSESLRSGAHPIPAFHWEVEFPETFTRENAGFDAFVGNPPFQGGRNLTASQGEVYSEWLGSLHEESSGGADLVSHFFRRAFSLIRDGGTFGLIATNTIAQGDTRASGLRWICLNGGQIYCARKRIRWPGLAAVVVSVVHVIKGMSTTSKWLDDRRVETISAFLFHRGGHTDPARLSANAGKSFQGSVILGMGFTFDDQNTTGSANALAEMRRILAMDPLNQEVIFPYIGGEEVNTDPAHAHHRFVINFGERGEEECRARWPELMRIVEIKVKPERTTKDAKKYPRMVHEWWKYWNSRPELNAAIAGLKRVLVIARVGQHAAFTFLPSGVVFSEQLIVFPSTTYAAFCALQARPHEVWARFFSSSMKDDLRYTPSDCFETFAFPSNWVRDSAMDAAGEAYFNFRADVMVKADEGLTKLYNRFHDPLENDPAILKLRDLHRAMDLAVLNAYGWGDIPTNYEFCLDFEIDETEWGDRRKPWRYRWPDEVRDEVLARLLELNRRQAREESVVGARGGTKATRKPRTSSDVAIDERGNLFRNEMKGS